MKKSPPFTSKKIKEGLLADYPKLTGQYIGYESNSVKYRAKRKYSEDEKERVFLRHLATTIKAWYSSLPGKSEIEVQVALVNKHYYMLSSNSNDTVDYLYNELIQKASVTAFIEQKAKEVFDSKEKSTALDKERVRRHAKKLRARMSTFSANFAAGGDELCVTVNATDVSEKEINDFIKGHLDKKKIMLVKDKTPMHAEQKIMIALTKVAAADCATTTVEFGGTFRPCRGCFETLSVMQRYHIPQMFFNQNPGQLWNTTCRGHMKVLRKLTALGKIGVMQKEKDFDDNGRLIGLTIETFRPIYRGSNLQGMHHDTDSDDDDVVASA